MDRSGSEPVYLREVRCRRGQEQRRAEVNRFHVQRSVRRSRVRGGSGGLPGAGMTVST